MVEQGLSPRRTSEVLHCDMYTVQKYAVQFGCMRQEDATTYVKKHKPVPVQPQRPPLAEGEERKMCRHAWKQLITDNPSANRTLLITLDPSCYNWLRKNDLTWFEKHSPTAQNATHFDWDIRDTECLEKVQEAVILLRNSAGRPIWISLYRIALQTGLNSIRSQRALKRMPKTVEFLAENVETIVDWRKRKIIWAIRVLRENGKTITPFKISAKASIDSKLAAELYDFMQECLEQEEQG